MRASVDHQLIDTDEDLQRAVDAIGSRTGPWGVDGEMTLTGVHHCRLALLQVSDGEQTWLLDTTRVSAAPLLDVILSTSERLIVHDGTNDLLVIKRLYDLMPERILDTMLAARVLGVATPNLARLVEDYLGGVVMGKAQRSSNWCRRPLTQAQRDYAALDAYVLPHLAAKLSERLDAAGKWKELEEEHARLLARVRSYVPPLQHPIERSFAKRNKDRVARRRLRRLLNWRIEMGNDGNIDVVMGMGNRVLIELARQGAADLDALRRNHQIPSHIVDRYGKAIVSELQSATHVEKTAEEGRS